MNGISMLELFKNIFMPQHRLMSNFDAVNTLEAQARGMHCHQCCCYRLRPSRLTEKKLLGNKELSEHSELPGQKTGGMVLCGTRICEWLDIIYLLNRNYCCVWGFFLYVIQTTQTSGHTDKRGCDAQEGIQVASYIVNL